MSIIDRYNEIFFSASGAACIHEVAWVGDIKISFTFKPVEYLAQEIKRK